MRPKRPPLHPQWAARQPYGGKPRAKVSENFISPCRSSTRCAPNGRHCTHSGPHGSHMGGNLEPKCRKFYQSPPLIHPMRPKRPPLHPQWAARQPYGGKPRAKVSEILSVPPLIHPMRPKRPPLHPQWAARQPYGGKPRAKVSEILSFPAAHPPDAPQTAATAPTVGRTAAIWGET